jgi:hypothetical protein
LRRNLLSKEPNDDHAAWSAIADITFFFEFCSPAVCAQESKEDQATHTKFVVDDGSGKIECKQVHPIAFAQVQFSIFFIYFHA